MTDGPPSPPPAPFGPSATPPSGSGASPATTAPNASVHGAAPTCKCPTVEIQINNTPTTHDDLVGLKCEHPAHRSIANCRIRATGSGAIRTIVLTNPDGRLRFPNAADTARPINLPADNSWVPFQIAGEVGSQAIGDAVIEAHCQTATGDLLGKKRATVFWFAEAKIKVTAGAAYRMAHKRFGPVGGPAVKFSARARIKPKGVDCTAPQVANLRIGILQNAGLNAHSWKWSSPRVKFFKGVPKKTVAFVPSSITVDSTLPCEANDADSFSAPLYDMPGGGKKTLDPNCLKSPLGCKNGAAATSRDSPASRFHELSLDANDAAGNIVGKVTYSFATASIKDSFRTFAVIYNTKSKEVCALRERTWQINADSHFFWLSQKASPAASDAAVSKDPITTPPFATDLINAAANTTITPEDIQEIPL